MIRTLNFKVQAAQSGMKVQNYVRKYLGLSARLLIKQKQVINGITCNGTPCRSIDTLNEGDVFSLNLPEELGDYDKNLAELVCLYEDCDILVINKPHHMPMYPSPGHDCDSLLNAVANFQHQKGEPTLLFRPLYRLDRDTSGIVVLAKNRIAASATQLMKTYYAVCEGELPGSGRIDQPIGRKVGSAMLRETGHGEPAVTNWTAIKTNGSHTLLSIQLETGRTHQIRVHFKAIGHLLAGDDMYGGSLELIQRQALYCGDIEVQNKVLQIHQNLKVPVPEDIKNAFFDLL